jgi:hypothetical protein
MWAFPALTCLTIASIGGVWVIMAILPCHRLELWFSLALVAVIVAIGVEYTKGHRRRPGSTAGVDARQDGARMA